MMEPTLTQNSALYMVQHKVAIPRTPFFRRIDRGVRKPRTNAFQLEVRGSVFRWPRIQWRG